MGAPAVRALLQGVIPVAFAGPHAHLILAAVRILGPHARVDFALTQGLMEYAWLVTGQSSWGPRNWQQSVHFSHTSAKCFVLVAISGKSTGFPH